MDSGPIPESGMFQTESRPGQADDLALLIDTQALIETASTGQRRQLGDLPSVKECAASKITIRDRLLGIADGLTEIVDHKGRALVIAGQFAQQPDDSLIPEHGVVSLSIR